MYLIKLQFQEDANRAREIIYVHMHKISISLHFSRLPSCPPQAFFTIFKIIVWLLSTPLIIDFNYWKLSTTRVSLLVLFAGRPVFVVSINLFSLLCRLTFHSAEGLIWTRTREKLLPSANERSSSIDMLMGKLKFNYYKLLFARPNCN